MKDEFLNLEELYPDSTVSIEHKIKDKLDEIANTINEMKEHSRVKVAETIAEFSTDANDALQEDDLLKLYHDTSVIVDGIVSDRPAGELVDPGLQNLLNNPTACKQHLDEILEKMKGVTHVDGDIDSLRQKMHDKVDAVFSAHGYTVH